MLRRRTPLRRTTPLRRRSPLRRSSSPPAGHAPVFGDPWTLEDVRLRWALWNRCGGRCDVGGEPLNPQAWDPHHRIRRSQRGTDAPANLLVVCRAHHDRIHDRVRWAYDNGYLVHPNDDPTQVDVILHGRVRIRLGNDLPAPF